MRYILLIAFFTLALCMHGSCDVSDSVDDFAEFDFGESGKVVKQQEAAANIGKDKQDSDDGEDDVVVQDDDDLAATMEFDLFDDEEEFEGTLLRRLFRATHYLPSIFDFIVHDLNFRL